jgi:hypothetical protein
VALPRGVCLILVWGFDLETGHSPLRANCPVCESYVNFEIVVRQSTDFNQVFKYLFKFT